MSRVTNPQTESSVTCGFFNSINDRKYDAIQMSKLFDGVINDGIFASIGTTFAVKAGDGNTVNVGVGKAWFNHTWTENDAILPVVCEDSELLLDRIDAIVLEIDSTEAVRDNFIKAIKGKPSSEPARPELADDVNFHQHALCYIYRKAGSSSIAQADITNVIGTAETPFITGLMETVSLDELLGQWEDQLDQFVKNETEDFSQWYQLMKDALNEKSSEIDSWTENTKETIFEWFESIRGQLDTDPAAHLQNEIERSEVERILLVGLTDGTKEFSDDGTVISSVDSSGRKLVKTFTNDFKTCTTEFKSSKDVVIGRMIKTFDDDGRTVSTSVTIA